MIEIKKDYQEKCTSIEIARMCVLVFITHRDKRTLMYINVSNSSGCVVRFITSDLELDKCVSLAWFSTRARSDTDNTALRF